MTLFGLTVQPPVLSLFSSSTSTPLSLFSSHWDFRLPNDSFICLLKSDSSSEPTNPLLPHQTLIAPPLLRPLLTNHGSEDNESERRGSIVHPVLHIQSPTLKTTFIRCPPVGSSEDLGIKLPWMHIQIRNLGREFSFEIGVVDATGKRGKVRCSTFQQEPKVYLSNYHSPPTLHLPLRFQGKLEARDTLTTWSTIALHIPPLLPHFSSSRLHRTATSNSDDASMDSDDEADVDADSAEKQRRMEGARLGRFAYTAYIKIHANCRLRRVWFSQSGATDPVGAWELGLYASDGIGT